MDLQTVGSVVGIVGGIAGITALLIQWSEQIARRRELIRSLAKTIFISRKGSDALIRNEGDKRIRSVVVEAGVDLGKVSPPFGLTFDDFIVEVTPARIPLGDILPGRDKKAQLINYSGSADYYRNQKGGPWTAARVMLKPHPPPYLPAGMTSETVEAILAQASTNTGAVMHILLENYETGHFEDSQAQRRFVYEKILPGNSYISDALVDLSVCFTDFNDRRWQRREDGKVEAIGKE
jgi:hypothetical protein